MNKILLIDKPADWTSFDVVAKIRGEVRKHSTFNNQQGNLNVQTTSCQLPTAKVRVGHAGTLDPFATGLLIVLIGSETKNQDRYMKQDKEYVATLKLGETSTTGDPEGEITQFSSDNFQFSIEDIDKILRQFTGEISQVPPIYSAIKVDGKRAYALARAGATPIMKSRQVVIYSLQLLNYYPEEAELQLHVKCSSGTYIRTLAEDIGKALGCGAYLTALRRTKIGEYDVQGAKTVDETLKNLAK